MQRRLFIKSTAGFYLTLPLLEGLLTPEEARAQGSQPKPFLVTMRNGCGREDSKFWQKDDGAIRADANKGMAVDELNPYFAKLLFVNGVSPTVNINPGLCSHGIAASNLITCGNYTPGNRDGMEAAHEESFDHYLHKKWGGVGVPLVAQLGIEHQAKRHRFSWSAKEQEIPSLVNPFEIWKNLFGRDPEVAGSNQNNSPNAVATIQKGSLNAIRPQLQELLKNPRLSATDKEKLEQHLTAVNEFEKKLSALIAQSPPVIGPDKALVDNLNKHKGRKNDSYSSDLMAIGDLMMDSIALGIASGTRVATISMGVSIDFVNYRVGKYPDVDFHKSSHRNEAGMSEQDRHEQLAANDRFFAQRFRRLLNKLDEIPTAGGSLLDHGICQWLCDMGPHHDEGHKHGDLMHVVAGGGKIGMAQGKKISYNNELLMTRFLGTIGNALGAPGEKGGVMQDFHATQGKDAANATRSRLKNQTFTGVAKEMLTTVKS